MKRAVVVLIVLVAVFAGLLSHQLGNIKAGSESAADTSDTGYEYYTGDDEKDEDSGVKKTTKKKKSPLIKVDTKEDSITVLVNREYRMSSDYIPADLVVPNVRFSFYGTFEKSYVRKVTADALEKLFAAAERDGVILKAVSGYRSYARQKEIYDRNVRSRGKSATDLVSAKPGSSEHQNGLTIDVSSEAVDCALEESFGDTSDGKWLAKNCHNYGFIIRYPKDKTKITGYSYEPWHIRYVGKKLATYLYKKDLTLEEYYKTTTVDQQIKEPEGKIRDVAEDDKNEPVMTAAPTPKPNRKAGRVKPVITPTAAPTATKKPEATKKPKATKKPVKKPKATKKPKPVAKPTKKPAAQTPTAAPAESTVAPTVPDPGQGGQETTEENTVPQTE
ncbi:M15 family metallopeptidase [Jutongia sp.]